MAIQKLSPRASEFNKLFSERIKIQGTKQDVEKQKSLDKELKIEWSKLSPSERKELDEFYSLFGKWDPRLILKDTWE